jgi:hypothetical protein
MDNAARSLLLAEQHRCTLLKQACLRFIAAHAVDVLKTPGWLDLLRASPELSGAIIATMAGQPPPADVDTRQVRQRTQ